MAKKTYDMNALRRVGVRSEPHVKNYVRTSIPLHEGYLSKVFIVSGHVNITGMYMILTTATSNEVCTMAWEFDPDSGGAQETIASAVSIQNKAVGTKYYSELDGSAVVEVAAGTAMIRVLDVWDRTADAFSGKGLIAYDGHIDVDLSTASGDAGEGDFVIEYEPLTVNAKIYPGGPVGVGALIQSSTTSTTSSTSSTASTASTASTTSSTSSTSSTASTASTTSSTSSTSSTASTASTTSSTSSTSSTASTSSSSTSSTTSSSTSSTVTTSTSTTTTAFI